MLYNDNKTVDACRFCYMCRHICPVQNVTHSEADGARARASMLALTARGLELKKGMAESLFECALCGGCTESCLTGFDPTSFTRSARTEAIALGVEPEYMRAYIDSLQHPIQPSGAFHAETVLYAGGCDPSAALKVLRAGGVEAELFPEEPDCAADAVDLIGRTEETLELMKGCAAAVEAAEAKRIIVLSPDCARVFLREYKEWGVPIGAKIVTFSSEAARLLREERLKVKNLGRELYYHDPCRLARELEETDEGRYVVSCCAVLREFYHNRKDTVCCGGGSLQRILPELSAKMAEARRSQAEGEIVTACPRCAESLGALTLEKLILEAMA